MLTTTMVFVIDNDNDVTYREFGMGQAANAACFETLDGLDVQTSDWPLSRLAAIWNGFAGVVPFDDLKPVRKFENRAKALARIWSAIQRLAPPVSTEELVTRAGRKYAQSGKFTDAQRAEIEGQFSKLAASDDEEEMFEVPAPPQPPAPVASSAAPSDTTPMAKTKSKGAKQGAKKAAAAKAAKPAPAEKAAPKAGTKQAEAIRLMERKGGVKLTELMERFEWQAHTVRGFVSAALGKKLGLAVESFKTDAGERVYRIAT